jgi:hypothetical protein
MRAASSADAVEQTALDPAVLLRIYPKRTEKADRNAADLIGMLAERRAWFLFEATRTAD